jgi:1-phosphofructokinase/tagatose 6-phosphate kinase
VIVTVTPNAAIDKTLKVANLQLGQRHRCQRGEVLPGGKGINVARALKRLGEPVVAIGLAGGKTGQRIVEELTHEGILNDFVRIADESRTTTIVIDPTTGRQTEIFEYGPEVGADELGMLSDKLRYLAPSASAIVLAGSLPRRVDPDWYAATIRDLRRLEVELVLDSEGDPLRLGVGAGPDFVAPNQYEAEEIVGHEFSTDSDFAAALDEIAEMGPRNVVVTRETGLHARIREGGRVRRFQVDVEQVDPVSSVGSGDALLAGFLAARAHGRPVEDCLRQAVGCGTANTGSVGAGRFEPREATRYAALATVVELQPASA